MSTYTPKRSRRGLRLVVALALATTAAGGVFIYASSVQRQVAQQPQVRQEASAEPTQIALMSVLVARVDLKAHAITATARGERELPVAGSIDGSFLRVTVTDGTQQHKVRATVDGDAMDGSITYGPGKEYLWHAKRPGTK